MGLKSQHQSPARKGAARCGQGGGHLSRVVAVVIDQRKTAARCRDLTIALKAASHALEMSQCLLHGIVWHIELDSHRDRRQRIKHVVPARQVQQHR